ncbi:hypothetical protein PENANT_c038G01827 [Penicillium antarcticum]|uniref:Rit1 N-terminal domain-containing protein n=1 Tax=Penicillium antarcticum TaxID=416450 RepID=A0A1V6PT50_9EURO|nr:hypothetical protein PENANT_c038G01827 [Penicillium antarcticum]
MGSSEPLPTLESLHFPSAQLSISQTLSSLRRSALSVSNRLQSIENDGAFVHEVAEHYGLPLVANERCGSWYIPPSSKVGSAYFKSTDGHTGEWDFSLLMPDALSKTIPIWSAVLNRALFPSETAYHAVPLPPNYLGASEEAQIESRIEGFVNSLKSLKLDLETLRSNLSKPIRIAWANRSYYHPADLQKSSEYNLLVLCSASRRVHGAEMSEGGYIQGAGDDSEGWAHGLTPPVFWANHDLLKGTSEEDQPDVIGRLVGEFKVGNVSADVTGGFDASLSKRAIGKQFIRQRFAWLVSSKHDVNPSRATLQSVNAFLMS